MNAAILFLLTAQVAWSAATGPACRPRSELMPILSTLLQVGRTAASDAERAMFITRDQAGVLSATLWPATMQRRKATFRGAIPSNTVAIAHTHPPAIPKPSQHDLDEAARTGLPIYVVTRTAIYRCDPDRRITEIVWAPNWASRLDGLDGEACV